MRKFVYAARKIDEILVELIEREANREDPLNHVARQIAQTSITTSNRERGVVGLERNLDRIERGAQRGAP